MTTTGLREQKRRATTHALAQSAYDLAVERGVDGFTIDDVVDRAGYSRRTFANHFSCKEEAITALVVEQVRAGLESLPVVPADLSLLDWLSALAHHQVAGGLLGLLAGLQELTRTNPSLEPYLANVQREVRRVAQRAIAERAGPRVPELYSHLLVGAVYGALMTVLDSGLPLHHLNDPPPETPGALTVPEIIDALFTHLRTGF